MKSPIRYAGGKSRASKYITPHIPFFTKRIVSPFLGGGSLEIQWATELGINVVGYDIFEVLVNYWQHQLTDPHGIYDILNDLIPNVDVYKQIKEELLEWDIVQRMLNGWHTDSYKRIPKQMDLLKGAAYYWYNHNLSYGPMFLGYYSDVRDDYGYQNLIERVRDFKADRLEVKLGSFEESIQDHPDDFLYLDPPYLLSGDSTVNQGFYPNGNFPIYHNSFDHERLRDLLHNHKGDFLLSYNDCPTIREWYKDFTFELPSWNYSYGHSETSDADNVKQSTEILIIK